MSGGILGIIFDQQMVDMSGHSLEPVKFTDPMPCSVSGMNVFKVSLKILGVKTGVRENDLGIHFEIQSTTGQTLDRKVLSMRPVFTSFADQIAGRSADVSIEERLDILSQALSDWVDIQPNASSGAIFAMILGRLDISLAPQLEPHAWARLRAGTRPTDPEDGP